MEKIAAALQDAGLDGERVQRLVCYVAMLLEANRKFNLTGAKSAEQLLPHVLDSLSILPYVGSPLIDVGSGAGLPAIPLAVAAALSVTLVEANRKKAAFLQSAAGVLALEANVLNERAESAAHGSALRGRFKSATARAVASAPAVAELTVPFLEIGGLAILQRGRVAQAERRAVADAAPMLGADFSDEIPLDGQRCLMLLRKIAPTPARFPRRSGIPQKRPLCLS